MSVFFSDFKAHQIPQAGEDAHPLWVLDAPLMYRSDTLRETLTVPAGFETRMRLPIQLLGHGLQSDIGKASLALHDYLCREWYPVRLISWARAADVLREALAVEGVSKWRRDALYWAIRASGDRNLRARDHA